MELTATTSAFKVGVCGVVASAPPGPSGHQASWTSHWEEAIQVLVLRAAAAVAAAAAGVVAPLAAA